MSPRSRQATRYAISYKYRYLHLASAQALRRDPADIRDLSRYMARRLFAIARCLRPNKLIVSVAL